MEAAGWISTLLTPTKGTPKGFWDALDVWLKKPHVANRRLCGALFIGEPSPITSTIKTADLCNQLVNSQWDSISAESILFKVKGIASSLDDEEHEITVQIRDLLPKQIDTQPRIRELVLIDRQQMVAMFLPLYCLNPDDNKISPCADLIYAMELIEAEGKIALYMPQHQHETVSVDSLPPSSQSDNTREDTERVHRTCSAIWLEQVLLVKLARWSEAQLNTEPTSLCHVSVERYQQEYQRLKAKYGLHLVKIWPECTDPKKFVYEDIAIASYLMVLWEKERCNKGLGDERQTFVDLGCGNGLLVYILTKEGHAGLGIDVRRRKIWDMYGAGIQLKESTITPSDTSLFPDYDWLIGNHSDELTPWIPVMAARSSYHCRYLVLPCCPWDFAGKFSGRGRSAGGDGSSSQYGGYLSFVKEVGEQCGFEVLRDTMRIPSTKRVCFIGLSRTYPVEEETEFDKGRQAYIDLRCKASQQADTSDPDSSKNLSEDGEKTSQFCDGPYKKQKLDSLSVEPVSDQGTSVKQWTSGFKPREAKEKTRNCLSVSTDTKDKIVHDVFETLLQRDPSQTLAAEDGRKWRKGGVLSLAEVAAMFDKATLMQLKAECGGLQTLLRNCHHVFHVQGGEVKLRDWTSQDYDKYQAEKRKRKGTQSRGQQLQQLTKTRLCFFFRRHPDGCPLTSQQCRFAHGENELKTPERATQTLI